MDAILRVTNGFGTLAVQQMSDSLIYWGKGVFFFIVIGSLLWMIANRGKKTSLSALVRHLFPKELYTHPTMRVTYWSVLWRFAFWGPLTALCAVGTYALAGSVREELVYYFGAQTQLMHATWANVLLQSVTLVVSESFFVWVLHYGMHKVPLMWSIHRVHHSAEALGLTALLHTHPTENMLVAITSTAVGGIFGGIVIYLTGVANIHPLVIQMLAAYFAWEVITGVFEHSHIPISFGWLDRIFISPVLHQIHHSIEMRHRDMNYGGFFRLAIWDWMFGTLYIPEKNEQYRWGLNEEEYGEKNPHLTIRAFYLEPFSYGWSVIKDWFRPHPTLDQSPSRP